MLKLKNLFFLFQEIGEEYENNDNRGQKAYYRTSKGSKEDLSKSKRHGYYDLTHSKRSKSLESLKGPGSSTLNEIHNEDIFSPNNDVNLVHYGNDKFYKTLDGRLIKITPKEGNNEEYTSSYNAGKFKNDNRKSTNFKKNQVYFADEIPYNGNESLQSIDNIRIPSGCVTIVRNANGDLVYYNSKGNIIDVKSPLNNNTQLNRRKNRFNSKILQNDSNYSLDGTTFIDSGYNTTLNASSQIKSQRQTPISHLHPESYQNNQQSLINEAISSSSTSKHYDSNNIPNGMINMSSSRQQQYPNLNNHDNRGYVPTSISSPTLHTSSRSNQIPLEQTMHNTRMATLNHHQPLNVIDQNRVNGGVYPSYFETSKNYVNQKAQQKRNLLQQPRYKQTQSNIINDNPIEYIQSQQVPLESVK